MNSPLEVGLAPARRTTTRALCSIRWTNQRLEYEADPRQAEKLIRDSELQGANAVTTPGFKPLAHQLEQ